MVILIKSIIINQFEEVENLKYTTLPNPQPGAHEVMLQVATISINPVDVKTCAGKGVAGRLKGHMRLILGWDILGIVIMLR